MKWRDAVAGALAVGAAVVQAGLADEDFAAILAAMLQRQAGGQKRQDEHAAADTEDVAAGIAVQHLVGEIAFAVAHGVTDFDTAEAAFADTGPTAGPHR